LVADIGGTNSRFGWVDDASGGGVRHVRSLPVAEHSNPVAAARAYLADLALQLGPLYRPPRWGAWAVATAVTGDEVHFTNSPWRFSRQQVGLELALDGLLVLNDFEALALSLPGLNAGQWRRVGPLPMGTNGTLAVIGPGTGLGVAGVTPGGAGWLALPGEGGHATLAPANDLESDLLAAVRQQHAHVSAERLLSGIGLPVLHQGLAQVIGCPSPPLAADHIVAQGLSGESALCVQTLDVFCSLLGGFAGNVALTLGARGGVYIGGGIVPRLGERFYDSAFRQRFEDKGRFRAYLQAVPTAVITDTLAALAGAALAIEQRLR
jgi:glucokinase